MRWAHADGTNRCRRPSRTAPSAESVHEARERAAPRKPPAGSASVVGREARLRIRRSRTSEANAMEAKTERLIVQVLDRALGGIRPSALMCRGDVVKMLLNLRTASADVV